MKINMYYSSVNIILLILLYQCLTTHTYQENTKNGKENKPKKLIPESEEVKLMADESELHNTEKKLRHKIEEYNPDEIRERLKLIKEFKESPDCYILMDSGGYYDMPIPITTDENPSIIHPRLDGMMIFKHNSMIRLSCTTHMFVKPVFDVHDVLVKCLNGSRVEFEGKPYEFETFTCDTIPKPTTRMTDRTCQNKARNKMMEVGFQTTSSFLPLYRVCFDRRHKIPVYSWYSIQAPRIQPLDVLPIAPEFNFTNVFRELDPNVSYEVQRRTVETIIQSKSLASWYIKRKDKSRYLEPGHLTPANAFPFPFEQYATYYHENAAAQWTIINRGIWRDVETIVKLKMAHAKHRHVIITGTFLTMSLEDVHRRPHFIYLASSSEMPVPEYIWKMDYNVDDNKGVVFVGRNNPFEHERLKIKNTFCPAIPCPGNLMKKPSYSRELMFCCTKETFEVAFGPLDPMILEQFNTY